MFAIRATRPFFLGGKVIAVGSVAMASAADALSAVGASRAVFVEAGDSVVASDAVRAADDKAAQRVNPIKSSFWARKSMNGGL